MTPAATQTSVSWVVFDPRHFAATIRRSRHGIRTCHALDMDRAFGDPPRYYETCIEGEKWTVRKGAKPGLYFFEWVTGPNKDYGFTSQSSDGSAMTTDSMDQAIRDFQAEIDPETGYLKDD
jgi:hypothetical protein